MTIPYTTGQISLTNGSAVITGVGTAWKTALIKGGFVFLQANGGNALPLLPDDSATANVHPITDTEMTSAIAWTGPTGTYKYALLRDTAYLQQLTTNAQALAEYIRVINKAALAALGDLTPSADKLPYFGAGAAGALTDITSVGRNVIGAADQAAARTAIGVGTGSGDFVGPNGGVVENQLIGFADTTGKLGKGLTPSEARASIQAGDVSGPAGGVTAKQIAGFGSTTGKAIVGLTAAEARAASSTPVGNFRNKIINPLFSINQRAVSGTVNLAAGAYGHDRMKAGSNGCTYSFSANNGVTTLNITAGSIQQVIEASSFAGEAGNYVLSWAGTAQGRINGGAYGASGAVTATIDGSANVTIEFTGGTVFLPGLEKDYVTPFAARHRQQEMSLCQRYYHWQSEFHMFPMSTVANALGRRGQLFFSSEMRVVPTVAYTPRSEIANSTFSATARFITFTSNVNSNDNWGIIDNVRIDAEL